MRGSSSTNVVAACIASAIGLLALLGVRGAAHRVLASPRPLDAGPQSAPAEARGDRKESFGRTSPPAEDVFRFVNGAEPETFDPALLSTQPDARLAQALFEGLVTQHPRTLEPVPGIARSWEVSPDGRTYRFRLRAGAAWTNGDAVTAHDFEWSWRRVLQPETPSRYADLFYLLRNGRAYKKREMADVSRVGVGALDDSTLQVDLEEPTPWFLQLVTYAPFLPVHRRTVERWGDRWTRPEHIVTNGPFRLVSHRPHDRVVLERFERYWDRPNVRLQRVVAYSIDDLSTMIHMYRAGMTDWNPSGFLPAQYIPYVRRFTDFRTGPFLATYFYSFNVTQPPFDDVRVRRALALAVDREKITTHLLYESKLPWGHLVPPGFEGYPYPEGVRFDPVRARRLLAEAGYPGGRGFPRAEILFSTSQDHRKIAEAIQEMWKRELGIEVGLVNQEFATYMRSTTSLQYQIARRSWIADYMDPSTFLFVLRGGDGNNRSGWSNARFDTLLAETATERDGTRRFATLAAAESLALAEMPFLPIYAYRTVELVAPYVRGWYPTPMDVHPLKALWFDRTGGADRTARSAGAADTGGYVP